MQSKRCSGEEGGERCTAGRGLSRRGSQGRCAKCAGAGLSVGGEFTAAKARAFWDRERRCGFCFLVSCRTGLWTGGLSWARDSTGGCEGVPKAL